MESFYQMAAMCILCLSNILISAQDNSTTSVPLSVLKTKGLLRAMQNSKDFAEYLLEDYDRNPHRRLGKPVVYNQGASLLGSESLADVERSEMAAMLNHAGCQPYDQVVPLANSRPDVIMYPSCVLAKQCGGCCGHPALQCRASQVEEKLVQVAKYIFDGSNVFPEEKIDYVSVEEHTACECMCKVQESDCNPVLHVFDSMECECKCKNDQESGSCPTNKRWNPDICECQCSTMVNCGTGYRYNLQTCTCEEETERTGNVPNGVSAIDNSAPPSTVDQDPCPNLRCPRRYKATLTRAGTCTCRFDRSSRNRG